MKYTSGLGIEVYGSPSKRSNFVDQKVLAKILLSQIKRHNNKTAKEVLDSLVDYLEEII